MLGLFALHKVSLVVVSRLRIAVAFFVEEPWL